MDWGPTHRLCTGCCRADLGYLPRLDGEAKAVSEISASEPDNGAQVSHHNKRLVTMLAIVVLGSVISYVGFVVM